MDLLCTCGVEPVGESPRMGMYGYFTHGTDPPSRPYSLTFSFFPAVFAGCLPRPISVAVCSVAWCWPRFRYYSAVRLLVEHHSPFRVCLSVCFPRCHPKTPPVLLRSRAVLPYRAVRTHLGAVGE